MLIKEIMTDKVVTIDTNATVFDACKKYHENRVGSLIVVDKNSPVGIITERDIIERVVLADKNPHETKVADIMSKDLKVVHALEQVEKAADLMREHKIKKLPVVLDDKIVGIVTVTDISNVMPQISKRIEMEVLSSRYLNQMIKIKATYGDKVKVFDKDEEGMHYIEDGTAALKIRIPENIDTSTLIPGSEYYWTGFLRRGKIMGDEELYMEVVDIVPAP